MVKLERNSVEYRLAERVVFLEEALETANKILNERGMLGVGPDISVSFRDGRKHHARVRNLIKNL